MLLGIVYAMLWLRDIHLPHDTAGGSASALQQHGNLLKIVNHYFDVPSALPAHNPWASVHCMFFISLPAQAAVMALLAIVATAFGLMLSASVTTPDRANALTPYVLIPQILLCGAFLPLSSHDVPFTKMEGLAGLLSPVFWAFRAMRCGANRIPQAFPQYRASDPSPWHSIAALVIYTIVLLAIVTWLLRRKEATW